MFRHDITKGSEFSLPPCSSDLGVGTEIVYVTHPAAGPADFRWGTVTRGPFPLPGETEMFVETTSDTFAHDPAHAVQVELSRCVRREVLDQFARKLAAEALKKAKDCREWWFGYAQVNGEHEVRFPFQASNEAEAEAVARASGMWPHGPYESEDLAWDACSLARIGSFDVGK